jgi:PAS domain S-box-containing protein
VSSTQSSRPVIPESRVAQVGSGTGWLLVSLGLIVLSGWAFHISALISVVPTLATMKPNTAAAFLLTGLALVRRKHGDCRYYSFGVFAIGACTLLEYLSYSDFGIDQLLFRDPKSAIDPGRMSLITCLGFTLLGPALAVMSVQSEAGRRVSRSLGLLTGALGFIALLGYSYDTQALYRVRPYSSVALHTAIAFVIAAIGVQCANPAEGVFRHIHADSAGGSILRRLLPAALLIPYSLGFAAWIAHKHLAWEMGFSLALLVAATMLCLVVITFFNAKHLERQDLARREINRALEERTASLQAREELLRIFVKHVPAAVAMFDPDMRYLQVSDRWCSDFALDPSKVLGCSHYEVLPDVPERWKEFHRRGFAGETLRAEEDYWDRGERGATWVRWEIRPWGSSNGLPEGILIFSEDITRRKHVEEMLRESEATTRALLETAGQAILAVDGNGAVVLANQMAVTMFGYAPDELLGKTHDILLPEHLREPHSAQRARFISDPRTRPMGIGLELLGLKKDGSEFPVEISLSSVQTGRGPLAVAFVSDITFRKQAEAALRESEQQLRVLAGSLLNAQEDERRRLSRELHDDITQRLAFLSVELGKLAGEMPDALQSTNATIRTLQDQTLQIATEVRRLSHGLHPSVIEDFGLSIALEEFCTEFEKSQAVRVNFDGLIDDSRWDDACAACLYRITQESLRNAVTHGHATEVFVTLSVAAGSMELRIRDNGNGFSIESPRTKPGLGLVSMRERIRLVNGKLTLSSKPGHGTEVIASVPLNGVGHE